MTKEDEALLIRRALRKDQVASTILYEKWNSFVMARVRAYTPTHEEAEELSQEVWLNAFEKLSTFRGDARLSTWLYRIATNVGLMFTRKKKLSTVSLEAITHGDPKAYMNANDGDFQQIIAKDDEVLNAVPQRLELEQAISVLPPKMRTVLILKDIHQYEHKDIAKVFDTHTGNSKSQLSKARRHLRKALVTASLRG